MGQRILFFHNTHDDDNDHDVMTAHVLGASAKYFMNKVDYFIQILP
jgi:hypothetical protein